MNDFSCYNLLVHKHLLYRLKKAWHFVTTLCVEALPANLQYGFPARQLTVFAITGTDGKTTTSTLLYSMLKEAGVKVGLISTVAAYIGDQQLDTGFHVTTPEPRQLQAYLRKMVDQGFEAVVLEMTSHGIYQYRTWGIIPQFMGLTNITNNEALEYHLSYPNYLRAKLSKLQQAKRVFINQDDISYPSVVAELAAHPQVEKYSLQQFPSQKLKKTITQRFSETYNQSNALLASTMALGAGVEEAAIRQAVEKFPGIPGRMQVVTEKPLKVIVDFAHTPNALREALAALRPDLKPGKKLIAVFGCAGLRDQSKRPAMANIAVELADYAIFTAEDPRTEDVWTILRQMKEQLKTGHGKIHSIPDRYQAIEFAIHHLAKPGDIVGIFGKGHEQSMCYGTVEYPWNDVEAVKKILGQKIET